jgi:hypothetical protein
VSCSKKVREHAERFCFGMLCFLLNFWGIPVVRSEGRLPVVYAGWLARVNEIRVTFK